MVSFSVHFLFPFPHSCADSFYTRYTFLFPSGLRSSRSTRSQRHLLVGQWHLPEKLLHELRLQPVFYTLPILLITRRVPRCSPLFFSVAVLLCLPYIGPLVWSAWFNAGNVAPSPSRFWSFQAHFFFVRTILHAFVVTKVQGLRFIVSGSVLVLEIPIL